jgi:hypothetical protein
MQTVIRKVAPNHSADSDYQHTQSPDKPSFLMRSVDTIHFFDGQTLVKMHYDSPVFDGSSRHHFLEIHADAKLVAHFKPELHEHQFRIVKNWNTPRVKAYFYTPEIKIVGEEVHHVSNREINYLQFAPIELMCSVMPDDRSLVGQTKAVLQTVFVAVGTRSVPTPEQQQIDEVYAMIKKGLFNDNEYNTQEIIRTIMKSYGLVKLGDFTNAPLHDTIQS